MLFIRKLRPIQLWLTGINLWSNLKKTELYLHGFKQRLSYLPESLEVQIKNILSEGVSTKKYLGMCDHEIPCWLFHIKEIS